MFINIIDQILYKLLNNFISYYLKNVSVTINDINEYLKKIDINNEFKNYIKNIDNINIIKDIIDRYIYVIYIFKKYYNTEIKLLQKTMIDIQNKNKDIINDKITFIIIRLVNLKNDIIKFKESNYDYNNVYYDNNYIKKINVEYFKSINYDEINIIIILLFTEYYYKHDKYIIYDILEKESIHYNKFKYINIVKTHNISYNYYNIEKIFNNINNIIDDDILTLYNLLNDKLSNNITIDNIINKLFINKIIKPITDEFLLINNNTVFYLNKKEQISNDKEIIKKNAENVTIKIIMKRINEAINYYKQNKKYEEIFDLNNYHKKALSVNDSEHIFILQKILKNNDLLENNENKEYYNNLIDIRKNSYVNFNSFNNNNGISFNFTNIIPSIRYSNIEFNKILHKLDIRNIGDDIIANLIGFTIISIKNKELLSENYNDNFKKISDDNIEEYFYKKDNKYYYKIFKNDNIKKELFELHNKLEYDIYQKILLNINKNNYKNIKKYFIKRSFNLNINLLLESLDLKDKIINMEIINENYISEINKKILDVLKITNKKIDKKIDKNKKLIKLPYIKKIKNNKNILLITNKITNNNEYYINNINLEDSICQHNIDKKYLSIFKKQINTNKNIEEQYNIKFNEYVNKYGVELKNGNMMCKICFQNMNIKKYIINKFDVNNDIYIKINTKDIDFDKQNIIKISKQIIKKLILYSNNKFIIENERVMNEMILLFIEITNILNNLKNEYNIFKENNINNDNKILVSKFIYININDNTINNYFDNKSIINNIDENRIIKNNIIIFLTLLYIINLDRSQILNLKFEKINNYTTYSINGNIYFDKVKIYISKQNKYENILNYNLLCYLIYYLSNLVIKNNLWIKYTFEKNENINNLRIFISTMIDQLNFICNNNNYFYNSKINIIIKFMNLYYYKVNNIYDDNEIIELIKNKLNKKIIVDNGKLKIKKEKEIPNITFDNIKYENINNIQDVMTRQKKYLNKNNNIQKIKYNKEFINNIIKINIDNIYYNYDEKGNIKINKNNNNKINKDIFIKIIDNINNRKRKINTKINNKKIKKKKNLQKINDKYNNKKYYDEFINILNDKFNNELNVNILKIKINDNEYIIDHDYKGNKLKNKLILNMNQITQVVNKNLLQYVNNKQNIIIQYYDINRMNLLYYKENNKITYVKYDDNNLILNYSLKYKLNKLGYILNKYEINKNEDIIKLINVRYSKIKDIINNFLNIVTKINNNTIDIKIYRESFKGLNINLPNINKIKKIIFIDDIIEYNINSKKLLYNLDELEEIIGLNKCSKLINYFCKLLIKIYNINNNNSIVLSFITLFINNSFDESFTYFNNKNKISSVIFDYYQDYGRYLNNMLSTEYIDQIIDNNKFLFEENLTSNIIEDEDNINDKSIDSENEENLSDEELEYENDFDIDPEDKNEDADNSQYLYMDNN